MQRKNLGDAGMGVVFDAAIGKADKQIVRDNCGQILKDMTK